MGIDYSNLNWPAIGVCVVVGQIFLTIWFVAIFGEPWARAYGAADKAQHTKEVPGYTYAIGLVCMILLTIGIAALQRSLGVTGAAAGLTFGVLVALHFCIATALPGYAFLKRWNAFYLAIGSQTSAILIVSLILAVWQK